MKKVYEVIELYEFDGAQVETTIFNSLKKAKKRFNEIVKREETTTWINSLSKRDTKEIEKQDIYYHAYDSNNYYATTIYIREKEIL